MTKLRDLARDQECQIRLVGVCNRDNRTVVLAHYRMIGISGFGFKPPDWLGAWACSNCHDAVDRRRFTHLPLDEVKLAHATGVFRTLHLLKKMGINP